MNPQHRDVVVVGGGQAGLAVSWYLTRAGTDHVVIERDSRMHAWTDARWDSFCLVTPNWQCRLPGYHYSGPDPDGFMVGKELVQWLEGYVESFDPPLREHTAVTSVRRAATGGFDVATTAGAIRAKQVVVATGGYHDPRIPALASRFPESVMQLHSSDYRNPQAMPDGPVLVVGTGQSGAQIAEDLLLAGRDVHLAVGSAPRFARRYRGRDVIAWLHDTGHYDRPVTEKPLEERTQDKTNHYVTGRDGGRDIDLRAFALQGMTLHGHLHEVADDGWLSFADDLTRNLDHADSVYNGINELIDEFVQANAIAVTEPASRYQPVWQPGPGPAPRLHRDGVAAVVWATGFTRDYGWLQVPVFDAAGHPQHLRGVTDEPGLYFVGLPWLHTWGSGRFAGIERDAAHVASAIEQTSRGIAPVAQ